MADDAPSTPEVVLTTKDLTVERIARTGVIRYRFSGTSRTSEESYVEKLGDLRLKIGMEESDVELDLENMGTVNSAFLGLIAGLASIMSDKGRKVVLIRPNRKVRDLLRFVGVLELVDVLDSDE